MRKLILAIGLFFLSGGLYAQQGPASQNQTQQIQTQRLPRGVKIPSPRLDPRLQLGLCSPVGRFECDMEQFRFRKCEQSGFWGRWVRLSDEEENIMRSCMAECVPGEIICPFRDRDYRICLEEGTWSEFRRLGNNQESDRVNAHCSSERANQQCWPGQYRCFNDGGYNRCGNGGYWSEAGNTSLDFSAFLNHCAFPNRRR